MPGFHHTSLGCLEAPSVILSAVCHQFCTEQAIIAQSGAVSRVMLGLPSLEQGHTIRMGWQCSGSPHSVASLA